MVPFEGSLKGSINVICSGSRIQEGLGLAFRVLGFGFNWV